MMSGGGLFGQLDYSFSVGSENGTDAKYNAPSGGSVALRKLFKILKNYLESLDLASLKPDKSFVNHVEGAFSYALRDAQNWSVYIEPLMAQSAKIHLNLPKGNYSVAWQDVKTGQLLSREKVVFSSETMILTSPSGVNDKVLTISKIIR